jgi:hypothetical protein
MSQSVWSTVSVLDNETVNERCSVGHFDDEVDGQVVEGTGGRSVGRLTTSRSYFDKDVDGRVVRHVDVVDGSQVGRHTHSRNDPMTLTNDACFFSSTLTMLQTQTEIILSLSSLHPEFNQDQGHCFLMNLILQQPDG